MLDEIGVILVKQVLEMTDVMIKDSAIRKRNWSAERANDPQTLTTIFGDVKYVRRYYKHSKAKDYLNRLDQLK